MRKKYPRLISAVTLLSFTVILTWYLNNNWAQFQGIDLVNPLLLLPTLILIFANIYCVGAVLELAIEPHGVKLSKNEIFGLSALTRFANHISPSYLGAAIRATYLKKNYDVSYAKFTSSFALSNVLQFLISGLLVLTIFFLYIQSFANFQPILVIIFALFAFFTALYMPVGNIASLIAGKSAKLRGKKAKVLERLSEAVTQYDKVRSHPGILVRTLWWMLTLLFVSSITLWLLYRVLGFDVDLVATLFITSIAGWTIIFSITPAGIGIREGLMVFAANLAGVSIPATLTAAILLRVLTFLTISTLSSYYAPKLLNTTIRNLKSLRN